jgi:hypothetical protein
MGSSRKGKYVRVFEVQDTVNRAVQDPIYCVFGES